MSRRLESDARCASPSSASGISAGITRGFCRRCRASSSSRVVDTNRARAAEIAAAHGTRAADRLPRAARAGRRRRRSPCRPSCTATIALPFLERGVAGAGREADGADRSPKPTSMIAAARDAGATLAVGHTERFNPAVAAARPLRRPTRGSSKCIGSARFPSAASTSTSSST